MSPYKFLHLAREFNALLDTGKYDDITLERIYRSINSGRLREFLGEFDREVDFSIIEEVDWTEISDEWKQFANAIDAGRKLGVSERGLCLLVAYAIESAHMRYRRSGI